MEKYGHTNWAKECEDFTKHNLCKWIFRIKARKYWEILKHWVLSILCNRLEHYKVVNKEPQLHKIWCSKINYEWR